MNGLCASYQPAGASCSPNSNKCLVGQCDGNGTCNAGSPRVCNTPPNARCYESTGTCSDPATGACTYTKKAAGTACDDGDPCTYDDQCQPNGDCKGAQGLLCTASDACPIAGTCDGKGGCTPPPDRDTRGNCGGKHAGDACTTCNPCLSGLTCDDGGNCGGGVKATNGTACSTDSCYAGVCTDGVCACMSMAPPDMASGGVGGGGSDGTGTGSAPRSGCDLVPVGDPPALFVLLLGGLVGSRLRRRIR
jgi:hypothetical protein